MPKPPKTVQLKLNQAQLDLLLLGGSPQIFNSWRKKADQNRQAGRKWVPTLISLPGAVLVRANLQEADLRDADLREASLQEADLNGANLENANIQDANFKDSIGAESATSTTV
jgi:uncharacterized protein YjbI with pentapeptide repeats